MTKRNFLLGKGERLVEPVVGVRGGGGGGSSAGLHAPMVVVHPKLPRTFPTPTGTRVIFLW